MTSGLGLFFFKYKINIMIQLKATNKITLENVKKSNYWDLISLLVWNHYSEKKYQDEGLIEITENWYGKGINNGCASYSYHWDNPSHTEEGYLRTLNGIKITLKRSDYNAYINIGTNGRVECYGVYNDVNIKKTPNFYNAQNNVKICNWLLANEFLTIE